MVVNLQIKVISEQPVTLLATDTKLTALVLILEENVQTQEHYNPSVVCRYKTLLSHQFVFGLARSCKSLRL